MKKIIAVPETYLCNGCIFREDIRCNKQSQQIDGKYINCGINHIIYKEIDTITESKEYKEITEIVVKVLKEYKDNISRGSYVALYIGVSVYILASSNPYKIKGSNWVSDSGDDLFVLVEELDNYTDFIKENMEYMI